MIDYKEEYEKLTKPCSVCKGSGEYTYGVGSTPFGADRMVTEPCSHCDNGRVPRSVVSDAVFKVLNGYLFEGGYYDDNAKEIPIYPHPESINEKPLFKLTRLPSGMWEVEEVKE